MISHKNKLLYVNVGKCGSVSISKSIKRSVKDFYIPDNKRNKQDPWRHSTAIELIDHFGSEVWDTYSTFTVVRNPWSRLLSMFRFNIKGRWITHHCDDRVTKIRKECRRFLRKHGHNKKPAFLDYAKNHVHRKPMFEYLCDEEDNILVDKVFRLEFLSKDTEPMADFLSIPDFKLKHSNKTDTRKQEAYTDWYDIETIEAVGDIYRKDIDIFGYEYS